ncbi:unnamed protein product [Paramecium sonneborni]|uniref:Uncharacterized protein n=1 Tax=Paramecium sonneborni TaxID=65129 RepID=A0A8S1M8A6_9CILI|nr:unnamed protein product [Paramecium sonneborni]
MDQSEDIAKIGENWVQFFIEITTSNGKSKNLFYSNNDFIPDHNSYSPQLFQQQVLYILRVYAKIQLNKLRNSVMMIIMMVAQFFSGFNMKNVTMILKQSNIIFQSVTKEIFEMK